MGGWKGCANAAGNCFHRRAYLRTREGACISSVSTLCAGRGSHSLAEELRPARGGSGRWVRVSFGWRAVRAIHLLYMV